MEIVPIQDMYNGDNATAVVISIVLFILNTIVALIDTNTYIKDSGIGDRVISKGKFLYSYIGGYFTYFLKITVMIFTLYILLTIIRIAVITIFNIMKPLSGDGAAGMSSSLSKTLFDKYKEALKDNALWLMGIYFIDMFLVVFVVFAPLLIFFIILGFSILIYENGSMKDMEDNGENEKALQILNTVHHHMMFIISICVAILILYMIGLFSHNFAGYNTDLSVS
jgi:hypothetical protein